MANFSFVSGAKFRPFSYLEIMLPLLAYTEEYNTIQDGIGDLGNKAALLDKLANELTDPKAYALYKAYANDLNTLADLLSKLGLTPESRKSLLNMKRRYSSDIIPIENAYNKRESLTKEQREAYQRDPSMMFDVDYSTTSLDNLINNPNATYKGLSGSELTKKTSLMALNLAKTIQENPQYSSILGGQYFQQMLQMGYSPELVMQTILEDDKAPKELKKIASTVWNEYGLDNWDFTTQLKAKLFINSGLYDAIGTKKYDTLGNRGYISPIELLRLDMDKERLELMKNLADKSNIPLPDGSTIRITGAGKAIKIYPDGKVENFMGNNGITGSSIKDVSKVGSEPIIVANTNGAWRIGKQGNDVPSTLFGATRSNAVSAWGNYTLDNYKPEDKITNFREIPKEALDKMFEMAKKENLDLDLYDVIRVKAESNRAAGNYDYVLVPKQEVILEEPTSSNIDTLKSDSIKSNLMPS